ncbi:adenosylcobinamide-GDP ribazoletransferase [Stappia taiwanensis]|uniref:Adenosylcobinamide-GDP ribazoletransferase n=1 Tax=Stappia taiwanensis TaxID=992267 RepID=A0A838XFA4_9HYPH|nr:adenosylcobinamide-GDP ribazoletransferase [Stappia taiwanensis]MBA4610129.1 adenosylcobinamide-GDP ribazoletransferase [Stappia taiwanensis]GGE77130.1 adenosylcobinamide-GDP ribazoletransferase [Stappia taiwanensis]
MPTDQSCSSDLPRWSPALLLADLAGTARFFSRLPIPRLSRRDDPSALPDFRRAAALAPLAGGLIALPGVLLFAALSATALPLPAVALIALGLGIAVTGALHEDGLADLCDGFFGGATPERRLEIMKDSRIGAFGTLALIVTIGLKAVLLAALAARSGPLAAALGWWIAEAGSRAVMVTVWNRLPAARPGGLAALCGQPDRTATLIALGLGLLPLLPATYVFSPLALLLAAALAGASGLLVARLALGRIGGQTGDVLGASQQLALLGTLTGLCAVA